MILTAVTAAQKKARLPPIKTNAMELLNNSSSRIIMYRKFLTVKTTLRVHVPRLN
jgi:hypothetical protein